MTKRRLLFYCQPVLGLGHLVRSLAILRGLTDFEVWFVNGGAPLGGETHHLIAPDLHLVDLPPLVTDREFSEIRPLDPTADPATVGLARQRILIETLARVRPDILLVELYPFGRIKFDFELRPLLEAARMMERAPRIVCSLRDILVAKRDQVAFEQFAITTANNLFDLILVHSDPDFQRLDETFLPIDRLTCPIEYTGYVVPLASAEPHTPATPPVNAEPTIVVSIGGGRVGIELLRATIAACRRIHEALPHRLRIFTGPYLPESDWRDLTADRGEGTWISITRFSPNLVDEMRAASLSISMAGYNTCLNILVAGVPSIVHPFTGNNNDEQTRRARKLEKLGVVRVITEEELTPAGLATIIRRMLAEPLPRMQPVIDLRGVTRTAQLLRELPS